jgi:hypothetical protein
MYAYDTVVEAINDLKKRGYSLDFNLAFDKLICHDKNICLNPAEFEIMEVYRFEGSTNPSDEDVVYAIESKDGQVKGVFTGAYGVYMDSISTEILNKLTAHKSL